MKVIFENSKVPIVIDKTGKRYAVNRVEAKYVTRGEKDACNHVSITCYDKKQKDHEDELFTFIIEWDSII